MRIAEVPTTLSVDGRSRPPHLRPWRDGWRHLRFMLLFSPRWLFLIPGLFVFLFSLLVYAAVLIEPVKIGSLVLDIHTLFYAQSGIVLGFIAMILGVIIRMFAMREGLLKEHSILSQLRDTPVLEIGSVVGLAMLFSGLYLGFSALVVWSGSNFGALPYGELLRTVSFSTFLIMLGGITFMGSLIMGFLALPTSGQR